MNRPATVRRLLVVAGVAPVALAAAIPVGGQPGPNATWVIWQTDQGCLYYKSGAPAGLAATAESDVISITWEGSPCVPDKLISGTGMIVEVRDALPSTGLPGRATNRWACRMVNGLCDGTMAYSEDYLPAREGPTAFPPYELAMGCPATPPPWSRRGDCVPPVPPPEFVAGPANSPPLERVATAKALQLPALGQPAPPPERPATAKTLQMPAPSVAAAQPERPAGAKTLQMPAPAPLDLSGTWEGQQSRNRVAIVTRPDGFDVRAVTSNAGQGQPTRFVAAGEGIFAFSFPNGTRALVEVMGRDRIRITNPDGWTDVFNRLR